MIRKILQAIMTAFQVVKQRKFIIAAAFAGILFLMLIILLLAGLISFSPGIRNAVMKGNGYYSEGSYDKALKEYKKGLSEKAGDPKLNFNAGQASYSSKNYLQAVSYYDKASDTSDKYLNAGNACYRQADTAKDSNQKLQLLQQALELYHQGILKFPQEVSLKYNYELVKTKLDESKKNNQNKNDQDKGQQNKDKNKDQKDQQNQQQNKNGDGKDQQNKKDKSESSNKNKSKDKDKKQNQDSEQQKKDKQKQQQEGAKSDKKDNNKKVKGQDSSLNQDKNKASKSDKNSEEVAQVLQMLEKQEENSLKNNQEVKGKGKEDRYDW